MSQLRSIYDKTRKYIVEGQSLKLNILKIKIRKPFFLYKKTFTLKPVKKDKRNITII